MNESRTLIKSLMKSSVKNLKCWIKQVGESKEVDLTSFSIRVLLLKIDVGVERYSQEDEIDQEVNKDHFEK